MKVSKFVNLTLSGVVLAIGCMLTQSAPAAEAGAYKLEEAPKEASEVIAARESAQDKDNVTVVGRIGGRANPWIKGAAAFSIVDRSKKACNEIPGDTCKTPWDYCCESDLPAATALVMFVDENGKVVRQDARELLGVKELDTIYVQGTAKRDKSGNITVLASKFFVPTEENGTTQ